MKVNNFSKLMEDIVDKCKSTLIQRGAHYASQDDFLANFKREAMRKTSLGFSFHGRPLTPESVALWFLDTKVDRWSNRLRLGKEPDDDVVDGINYILLAAGCHKEQDSNYPSMVGDDDGVILNIPVQAEYREALREMLNDDSRLGYIQYMDDGRIKISFSEIRRKSR